MAQVPNRYYNSPWIADAAKNLSLAIAGDPERDAARLQMKFAQENQDRETEKYNLAKSDRENMMIGRRLLGKLATSQSDEEAAPLLSEVINLGIPFAEADKAASIASPSYRSKSALLTQSGDQRQQLQNLMDGVQILLADKREAGLKDRNIRDNDTTQRGQNLDYAAKALANTFKWEALTDKQNKPINLPKDAQIALSMNLLMLASANEGKVTAKDMMDLLRESSINWAASGNPVTAAQDAFAKKYGPDPKKKEGKSTYLGFGKPKPGEFIPLSDLVSPNAPAPTPVPGVAPTSAPAPGVVPAVRQPVQAVPTTQVRPTNNLSNALSVRPFNQAQPQKELPQFFSLEDAAAVLDDNQPYIDSNGEERKWSKAGYAAWLAKQQGQQ